MDDSITIADKKRDYMLFLDNILVIGGEDRPMRGEMYVAQSELFEKHKGANAALYGDLGYIIMIATAGECARLFALDVRQGAQLQPLFEEFEVRIDELLSFGLLCARGFAHLAALGLFSMMLHCVIARTVKLVDLAGMHKTGCSGETRLVLHIPASS